MPITKLPKQSTTVIHDATGNEYTFEGEIQVKMGELWVSHCFYYTYEDYTMKRFARDFSNFMKNFSIKPDQNI